MKQKLEKTSKVNKNLKYTLKKAKLSYENRIKNLEKNVKELSEKCLKLDSTKDVPTEQNCQKCHANPSPFLNSYRQQETPFNSQENTKIMPKVNKFLSTETMYNENMENDSNSVYSKLVIFMTFLIGTISLIMSLGCDTSQIMLTVLTTLSSLGFSIIYSMGCKLQVFFDNLEIIVSHLNIALSKLDYIRLSFKKSQAKIFRQNISAS